MHPAFIQLKQVSVPERKETDPSCSQSKLGS